MIYIYNLNKELQGSYTSIKQAADASGVTPFMITQTLQGASKRINGLIFSTKELKKRVLKKCGAGIK